MGSRTLRENKLDLLRAIGHLNMILDEYSYAMTDDDFANIKGTVRVLKDLVE